MKTTLTHPSVEHAVIAAESVGADNADDIADEVRADILRDLIEAPPVELPRRVRGIGTGMQMRPTSGPVSD